MLQSCPDKWAASMVRCRSCAHCVPTLQVMKMLMPLLTPAAGRINFQLPEGAVLVSGDLIARLELDDSNAVTAAQPYPGGFPELGPPLVHSQGVDYRFKEAYSAAKMILEGGLHSPGTNIAAYRRQHSRRQACVPEMGPAAAFSPDIDDCCTAAFSPANGHSMTRCGPWCRLRAPSGPGGGGSAELSRRPCAGAAAVERGLWRRAGRVHAHKSRCTHRCHSCVRH